MSGFGPTWESRAGAGRGMLEWHVEWCSRGTRAGASDEVLPERAVHVGLAPRRLPGTMDLGGIVAY